MSSEAPEGWIKCKYESLLKGKLTNGLYKHADFYGKGNAKILDIGYLFNKDKTSLEGCSQIELTETERAKYKLQFGDILFNRVSVKPEGVGLCVLVEEHDFDLVFESNIIKSTLNLEHTNPLYTSYLLNSEVLRKAIFIRAKITAQASIGQEDLLSLELLLPPLPEQQKITQILTSVDEVIEKTQAQIDKLKDLKTAMMQELLTKGIGHLEFKDSPVGKIPVGWEVKTIEEVTTDVTYGLTVRPKYINVGVPLVSGKECKDGWLDFSISNKISVSDFGALRPRSLPKVDDVIMTKTGTVGRVALVRKEYPAFAISQNVALLTPNKSQIVPEFLELLLTSQKIKEQIRLGISTLSIPDLQLGVLKNFQISLPNQNEQKEIARIITCTKTKINSCNNKLSSILSLKKGLMQDLLTGKVRVNTDQFNSSLSAS
ncbi:restriction endonuclease subunit S [Paraglaciecola sp. L3A3]|uniref:restriction endonuclease subunit S n=1 Tax=Paraglaciecola sp. L3A3 TaxID=2686358 RepID=UPI00131C30B9|nr:restriction endonuclease subunit S [Paraglaciecola sp. L3A3]